MSWWHQLFVVWVGVWNGRTCSEYHSERLRYELWWENGFACSEEWAAQSFTFSFQLFAHGVKAMNCWCSGIPLFQSFCFHHHARFWIPGTFNWWKFGRPLRWGDGTGSQALRFVHLLTLMGLGPLLEKKKVIVYTCWILEPVVRPFRVTHPPCLLWGSGGFHCPQQAGSQQGMPDLGAKRCHDWQECNEGCNKFVAKVWFGYESGKNHPSTWAWFHPDFTHFIICFSAWELETLTGISSHYFLLGTYIAILPRLTRWTMARFLKSPSCCQVLGWNFCWLNIRISSLGGLAMMRLVTN